MVKVLVPVDGSANSMYAVRHVMKEFAKHRAIDIQLLNVQAPLPRHISQFVSRKNRASFHADEAVKAMLPARRALDEAGVPYVVHAETGSKAQVIAATARNLGCDHIVMSTARKNSLTRMIEASVTNQVLELTTVPVAVIAGGSVSRLERYGIPAGLGGAMAFLLLAVTD